QLFEGLHGLFPRPTVPFQGKRFARPPVTRRGTLVCKCRLGHTMRRATALTKKRGRTFKRPSAVLYWAPGTTCERPAAQVWRESRTVCSLATKAHSRRPRSWTPGHVGTYETGQDHGDLYAPGTHLRGHA